MDQPIVLRIAFKAQLLSFVDPGSHGMCSGVFVVPTHFKGEFFNNGTVL